MTGVAVGGLADEGEGLYNDFVAALAELVGEGFFGGFAGFFGEGGEFAEAFAEGRADEVVLVLADVGAQLFAFFAELFVGELGIFGFQGVDLGVEVATLFDVAFAGGAEQPGHGFADGFSDVHDGLNLVNTVLVRVYLINIV